MATDIKLSRSCEGCGNINDNITQLLCVLDKKKTIQKKVYLQQKVINGCAICDTMYYLIYNISFRH